MNSEAHISLTVTHRGKAHDLSLLPNETFALLQERLEELTGVPVSNQKLLFKGKKTQRNESGDSEEEATLTEAGLKDGMKVQMLGSTSAEVGSMKAVEDEQRRRDAIMKERAKKGTVKVRTTATSSAAEIQYRFHRLQPLPHLPNPASALALLERLAADPAIVHVMRSHKFAVGLLTELAPHEHPELLGLNENAGQAIKLRLRTNAYDGFRAYAEVRRVLCHELTHNVWGDHDDHFKELNSKLNREVAEYERGVAQGTHRLAGSGYAYEPSSELEAEARTYVLGGVGVTDGSSMGGSREEMRRRVLEATMSRLNKEEEELEQSCGTAGPAAHT